MPAEGARARKGKQADPIQTTESDEHCDPLSLPDGVPIRPFQNSLPMTLLRARASVINLFRPLHRERGVTEQQWRILRALYEADEIDILTLAERTLLMAPSISRILPELERRKLIARRPSKKDQRRSLIRLSRAGRKMIETHGPKSEQIYAEIEKRVGKERLRNLYHAMWELESALSNDPVPSSDVPEPALEPKIARRVPR